MLIHLSHHLWFIPILTYIFVESRRWPWTLLLLKASFSTVVNYSLKKYFSRREQRVSAATMLVVMEFFIRPIPSPLFYQAREKENCYNWEPEWKVSYCWRTKDSFRWTGSWRRRKKWEKCSLQKRIGSSPPYQRSLLDTDFIIIDRFCHIFFVCHIW